MADCEMCGAKDIKPRKAKVEGTTMTVCSACAHYGQELRAPRKDWKQSSTRIFKDKEDPQANSIIVSNYAKIIKEARERQGLKQEIAAKQLNEKESVLHNIEAGKFKPSFKLAKKLEKFFSVTLIENMPVFNSDVVVENGGSSQPRTMGDVLAQAMKKEK